MNTSNVTPMRSPRPSWAQTVEVVHNDETFDEPHTTRTYRATFRLNRASVVVDQLWIDGERTDSGGCVYVDGLEERLNVTFDDLDLAIEALVAARDKIRGN